MYSTSNPPSGYNMLCSRSQRLWGSAGPPQLHKRHHVRIPRKVARQSRIISLSNRI
jgi:hypothetical protein